jgi:ABC-type branched-subunit amino acid transport system ATPase component
MLELRNVARHFGGVKAVDGLDLSVRQGEILGLIGPNGSGKSTTVNLIAGLYRPSAGVVTFQGRDIGALTPQRRAELGIARTFQNIRLFSQLTVWQNLWAARVVREGGWAGFKARWLSGAHAAREEAEQLLAFSGLASKRDQLAGNLAFGEQRRLELARAAASGAPLLLLDEPAAGMNAEEIDDLDGRIRQLREQGRTIVLIEHHMELVMGV